MDAVDVLVAFPCLVCHVYEPPFPPVRSADDAGLTGSEHQVGGAVVCHVVDSESHKPRAVALAPYSDDVLAFSDESAVYGDEAVVGFRVGVDCMPVERDLASTALRKLHVRTSVHVTVDAEPYCVGIERDGTESVRAINNKIYIVVIEGFGVGSYDGPRVFATRSECHR